MFAVLSFLYGCVNTVSKMLNVKAGRIFGTVNGALINYLEATVFSLVLVFLLSGGQELLPAHLRSVPLWMYLGGFCGLAAMILIIFITPKTQVLLSSILTLVGNLSGALVMDFFLFAGQMSLMKIAGLLLILSGAGWIQWQKEKNRENAAK